MFTPFWGDRPWNLARVFYESLSTHQQRVRFLFIFSAGNFAISCGPIIQNNKTTKYLAKTHTHRSVTGWKGLLEYVCKSYYGFISQKRRELPALNNIGSFTFNQLAFQLWGYRAWKSTQGGVIPTVVCGTRGICSFRACALETLWMVIMVFSWMPVARGERSAPEINAETESNSQVCFCWLEAVTYYATPSATYSCFPVSAVRWVA